MIKRSYNFSINLKICWVSIVKKEKGLKQKKSWKRYENLSEVEKNKKQKYGCKRYRNL